MKKLLLFDLDGTLTESAEGITKSIQQALIRMGRPACPLKELEIFIGPPLLLKLMEVCGTTTEEAAQTVAFFRERYETVGKFENRLYPGITEMLDTLRRAGFLLAVATSKPAVHANEIAEYFHLAEQLDYIAAAGPADTTGKPEVIAEALAHFGYEGGSDDVWMIGDTRYDIEGAALNGIRSVGVAYGYGPVEDLRSAGADVIVGSVEELKEYLLECAGR